MGDPTGTLVLLPTIANKTTSRSSERATSPHPRGRALTGRHMHSRPGCSYLRLLAKAPAPTPRPPTANTTPFAQCHQRLFNPANAADIAGWRAAGAFNQRAGPPAAVVKAGPIAMRMAPDTYGRMAVNSSPAAGGI